RHLPHGRLAVDLLRQSFPAAPSHLSLLFLTIRPPPRSTLFPYTTLFRSALARRRRAPARRRAAHDEHRRRPHAAGPDAPRARLRSEEHTSELQSLTNLVCRLLLEKKKLPKQREILNATS